MTGPAKVEILLATYNGAAYIREQLDSLLAQSFQDFTVLISDDLSNDGTVEILNEYAATYPRIFRLITPNDKRLGASSNFARLLDQAQAEFVCFCDQDDCWIPEKLALSLDRMARISAQNPPETPILIHSDLKVVDARLNVMGASFFRYAGINPARNNIGALMLGNIATGCTLMANRALYRLARPVPPEGLMFDYWLAQVAAALGTISYIEQPTVLYRQHGKNLIGADPAGAATFVKRIQRTLLSEKTLQVLHRFSRHAEILLERYSDLLTPSDRSKIEAMAGIWQQPKLLRFPVLLRNGLHKPSLAANVGLAMLLLRNPKPIIPKP